MNWDSLDFAILGPALLAGVLVLSTHVPLGRQVLQRGIIFIDLAIAQVAGMGVIAAHSFNWEPGGWQVQAVAFTAALLGAALLSFTEKCWPDIQEALIGSMFALAATGSILLLATNPQAGEHLKELLVGQILWVSYQQLLPVALLYSVVLFVWWRAGARRERPLLFYSIFAITVTASVQMVGVYLVFASLIIPALGARKWGKAGLSAAYVMGLGGYGIGLSMSALLDLPAGAVVVWALALAAMLGAGIVSLTRRAAAENP